MDNQSLSIILGRTSQAVGAKGNRLGLKKDHYLKQKNKPKQICRVCEVELIKGQNWLPCSEDINYICADCNRKYHRKYFNEHREKRNTKTREDRKKLRLKVLNILGGKCVRCGIDDWRTLQIDHIKGDGKQDKNRRKSRDSYLKYILTLTENERNKTYQVLCANCNQVKKWENKEGCGSQIDYKKR